MLDRLLNIPAFTGLATGDLAELAAVTREVRIAADQHLFRHGDPAEHAFFLLDGAVTLYRDLVGRPSQLLVRLTPGDWCGEMCLFGEDQRSGSARAVGPGRLLELPRAPVLRLLESHPEAAARLQIAAARHKTQQAAATLDLGQQSERRIRLATVASLETGGAPPRQIELHNLSPGGVSFEGAPADWAEGDEVEARFHLLGVTLDRRARVVWRQQGMVGLAFVTPPSDHEEVIFRLLGRLSRQ